MLVGFDWKEPRTSDNKQRTSNLLLKWWGKILEADCAERWRGKSTNRDNLRISRQFDLFFWPSKNRVHYLGSSSSLIPFSFLRYSWSFSWKSFWSSFCLAIRRWSAKLCQRRIVCQSPSSDGPSFTANESAAPSVNLTFSTKTSSCCHRMVTNWEFATKSG